MTRLGEKQATSEEIIIPELTVRAQCYGKWDNTTPLRWNEWPTGSRQVLHIGFWISSQAGVTKAFWV